MIFERKCILLNLKHKRGLVIKYLLIPRLYTFFMLPLGRKLSILFFQCLIILWYIFNFSYQYTMGQIFKIRAKLKIIVIETMPILLYFIPKTICFESAPAYKAARGYKGLQEAAAKIYFHG